MGVTLIFLWDFYTRVFVLAVSLITAIVFMFRRAYIRGERHFSRFHLILLRFVASIFLLVLSPGLVRLLLG